MIILLFHVNKNYILFTGTGFIITALGISTYDIDRSLVEIETLFDNQWENGMIPHSTP